jgi:hypothetical protein
VTLSLFVYRVVHCGALVDGDVTEPIKSKIFFLEILFSLTSVSAARLPTRVKVLCISEYLSAFSSLSSVASHSPTPRRSQLARTEH